MKDILEQLGLDTINPGSWSGAQSYEDESAALIHSINPTTGETIASVRTTTTDEYNTIVSNARDAR